MQTSSQDGRGGRKLNEGDRSSEDVDLAAVQALISSGSWKEPGVREGRRGKAKAGRPHMRHEKGKRDFLKSQEQRGPEERSVEKGKGPHGLGV